MKPLLSLLSFLIAALVSVEIHTCTSESGTRSQSNVPCQNGKRGISLLVLNT